jgi:HD-GYP domain-containing protein (c-di-GMP phosphodiesterase class II)
MLERLILARDLVDSRGGVLAPAGVELSAASVRQAAAAATPGPTRPLADTFVASDLRLPLAAPVYRHLFRAGAQDAVARALLAAELPDALWEELRAMRANDPARYWHALATSAVSVRMLLAALGEATFIARMAAAGLLHDLGFRHVSPHLARNGDLLSPGEMEEVATHPLLGAHHVALLLGDHPAVEVALAHHWRNGTGYPRLPAPPPRSVEVVAVASSFAALTQPRAFRSAPFDARGAADVLIVDAAAGRIDAEAVRLLVHALRDGKGDLLALRFGRERIGHAPAVNRHTPIQQQAS